MSEYLEQHWILAIFLTIVVGVLSNALWDFLRPHSIKLGNALFSIITLGIKSRSDQIYEEAAKGHHEMPSIRMLLGFHTVLLSVPIALQIFYFVPPDITPYKEQAVNACAIKKVESEREHCILVHYRESIKPIIVGLSIATVFLLVNFFIMTHSLMKTNFLVTSFKKLLRIIRPYIDEPKLHLLEQKFALTKNKEDYESLMDVMAMIAAENGVVVSDKGGFEIRAS